MVSRELSSKLDNSFKREWAEKVAGAAEKPYCQTLYQYIHQALDPLLIPVNNVADVAAINYLKRMVSFTHGALIAIEHTEKLTDKGRRSQNALNLLKNITPEQIKQGLTESDFIAFFQQLGQVTGIDHKTLAKAEVLANWERKKQSQSFKKDVNNTLLDQAQRTDATKLDLVNARPLPAWFNQLSAVEQSYIKQNQEMVYRVPLPPTLRHIPGLANIATHNRLVKINQTDVNFIIERHGTLSNFGINDDFERFEATMNAAKEYATIIQPKAHAAYQAFWTDTARHDAKIGETPLVAEVSFMSPISWSNQLGARKNSGDDGSAASSSDKIKYQEVDEKDIKGKYFVANRGPLAHENNYYFKDENISTLSAAMRNGSLGSAACEFQYLNMTINSARGYSTKTFSKSENIACAQRLIKKIESIENYIERNSDTFINGKANQIKWEMALAAKTQLNNLFTTFATLNKQHEERNPELFADVFYALMVQGVGGTVTASCKSTKDRTGFFLMGHDAVTQFYARHKKMPDIRKNDDWKQLVDIMAAVYIENIQQSMASEQAYGAQGLKEPKGVINPLLATEVIPPDVVKAIDTLKPGLIGLQIKLAETNRPEKIIKKNLDAQKPWNELIQKVETWRAKKANPESTTLFFWKMSAKSPAVNQSRVQIADNLLMLIKDFYASMLRYHQSSAYSGCDLNQILEKQGKIIQQIHQGIKDLYNSSNASTDAKTEKVMRLCQFYNEFAERMNQDMLGSVGASSLTLPAGLKQRSDGRLSMQYLTYDRSIDAAPSFTDPPHQPAAQAKL